MTRSARTALGSIARLATRTREVISQRTLEPADADRGRGSP